MWKKLKRWLFKRTKGGVYRDSLRMTGHLYAKVYDKDGNLKEERDLGCNHIVSAGVQYMVDGFQDSSSYPISNFKYHDVGTGTTAPTDADTGLENAAGFTRGTGSQTEDDADDYKTVATVSATATKAITEWGLFSASTSGTMWSRHTFDAINVVSGDSIEFTYILNIQTS